MRRPCPTPSNISPASPTGSVGLGAVAPLFSALTRRYVDAHFDGAAPDARFIALVGDAELDEGNIWEAIAGTPSGVSRPEGTSSYLRLSTRPIDQEPFAAALERHGEQGLRAQVLAGGYRLVEGTVEGTNADLHDIAGISTGNIVNAALIAISE